MKAALDAVAAAEGLQDEHGNIVPGGEKKAFAFSNVIAALERDAVAFVTHEVNMAIEAAVARFNAARAVSVDPSHA